MSTKQLVQFIISLLIGVGTSLFTAALAEDSYSNQQAWEDDVHVARKQRPAFIYIESNPELPRVLLIGDSISVGYTTYTRKLLEGKANLIRIPANGGDTNRGMEMIIKWLGDGDWDIIHFNWGLHDLKRLNNGELDIAAKNSVSLADYEENLRALTRAIQNTGAKLIWASTTPIPKNAEGRRPGDSKAYNEVAARVMVEFNIPTNDLHALVKPNLSKYQRPDNIHFLRKGYVFLADHVTDAILARLPAE